MFFSVCHILVINIFEGTLLFMLNNNKVSIVTQEVNVLFLININIPYQSAN